MQVQGGAEKDLSLLYETVGRILNTILSRVELNTTLTIFELAIKLISKSES